MTNEEMIKDLSRIMDLLDMYIDLKQSLNITQMEFAHLRLQCIVKALEQQPCDDYISREEVRKLICQNNDAYGYSDRFHEFTEKCLQLPSVTTQPKSGEWVKTFEPNEAEPFILWECSECHKTVRGFMKSEYCPNCGSYNGGGKE